MMLKSFNIYELYYKHFYFVASADSFQRESAYEQQWYSVSLVTAVNKALMNSNDTVFPWLPL